AYGRDRCSSRRPARTRRSSATRCATREAISDLSSQRRTSPSTHPNRSKNHKKEPDMPAAKPPTPAELETHPVVSPESWLAARQELLRKEKEVTRLQDQLSQNRRDLPWMKVEKESSFVGPSAKETLRDLFDGR